jgi:hypothetical protein
VELNARNVAASSLVLVLAGALTACAHGAAASSPESVAKLSVPPDRSVCGWEQLEPDTPRVRIAADGSFEPAAAGQTVVVLDADAAAPYGAVGRALAPAGASLVRIKVVVDGRWLVPLTFPRPVHPHPPAPDKSWASMVGRRKVTRSTETAAMRFGEIRLDGEVAVVHVENAAPGGKHLAVGEIGALLRATAPPAEVFVLTATDDTPWQHLLSAAIAAACYDRKPGEEPHEVLLD